LKADLEEEWGINPGSSKQLREYFELDKHAEWPTTAGGAPKTDQDALKALVDEEPSVAKWVEWKEIEKIRSTYGKSIRDKLVDGRVHAGFKPFGTAKGRFSSSNPNLQNIPKRGELGPRIRGLFWAGAEDRVLIKADYASIELWLAAVRWEDPYMQDALQQGVNMHVATAAALFNVKAGEVAKEQNSRTHHERFPGLERALKAPLRDMANSPCWSVVGQGCGFQVFSGGSRQMSVNVSVGARCQHTRHSSHSPECVEGEFSEVRPSRVLRTSALRSSRKFGTAPAQHLLAVAEAMLLAYDGGVGKLGFVGRGKCHGRRQEREA
jgi:hypothetical protein